MGELPVDAHNSGSPVRTNGDLLLMVLPVSTGHCLKCARLEEPLALPSAILYTSDAGRQRKKRMMHTAKIRATPRKNHTKAAFLSWTRLNGVYNNKTCPSSSIALFILKQKIGRGLCGGPAFGTPMLSPAILRKGFQGSERASKHIPLNICRCILTVKNFILSGS